MKDNRKVWRSSYNMISGKDDTEDNIISFGVDVYINDSNMMDEMNKKIPFLDEFFHSYDYEVGDPIEFTTDVNVLKQNYDKLIKTCMKMRLLSRGYDNIDMIYSIVDRMLNWLRSTDFYDAPASTRYHESYKHGLLAHTLNVYNNMCDLWKLDKFHDVDIYSAALVALVHDWCKIGLYEVYQKNVKENGTWKQVDAFKRNSPSYPLGHGETSMFLADRFCKLTPEEATAIRWHMGKWYCHDALDNDLQTANETFPLVHMLQFADQLSITNY